MKKIRKLAVGVFFTLLAASAWAEDITYEFINYPELQKGYRMVGTITTDGTLGPLQATNIKTWNIDLIDFSSGNAAILDRYKKMGDMEVFWSIWLGVQAGNH